MDFAETCEGLRVLDLSENIAGPLACMVLGDMGADVIKIERPAAGDAARTLPPRWGDESAVFLAVNRNKRSITLDLSTPEGSSTLLRLVETADVLVTSFRPGAADKLGLSTATIRERNPRIVHAAINAFGTGEIGRTRTGYDALIQAYVGIMAMTGDEDGGPVRSAASIVDISTGLWATVGILAALRRRDVSGQGDDLEVSLVDSGLFLLCHQLMGFLGAGFLPGRLGTAAPSAAPYQVFETADDPIMIATLTDAMFQALCSVVGAADLAEDPRFADITGRVEHRHELAQRLQSSLLGQPAADWLEALWAVRVPAAPVLSLDRALQEPLVKERRLIAPTEDGKIPGLELLHLPVDMHRTGRRRQPPALGEHTAEVLAEVGLESIRQSGKVGST
jgi:crotonobetainyl-CoA:carnitine CoA-transferase CaiB-like acyl-CoA transferase